MSCGYDAMMFAYTEVGGRLEIQPKEVPAANAIWIDLLGPLPAQIEAVTELGLNVPTRQEMEEIEISNRLYHERDALYMTVVLPGQTYEREQASGPVTFILTESRMVTVRYHTPRPFETFPTRSDKSASGCGSALRVFVGLMEEIIGRLADLLEGIGRALDEINRQIFDLDAAQRPDDLRASLTGIGQEGERLNRVRLALLTLERALSHFSQLPAIKAERKAVVKLITTQLRDIDALKVHADFLSSRIGLATDTTLGMVNLAQNATVRIVSVVATLFLPPTLIASIYGMNFEYMPDLHWQWGYPAVILLMFASAAGTYIYFKWKGWL